jgi:hypothetical protein
VPGDFLTDGKTPRLSRRAKFLAKGKAYEAKYFSSRSDGGARRRQQ